MTPPRWTGPNADRTRKELLRRVELGDASAPEGRRGALRVVVAVVVALALVVPASFLAFQLGGRSTPGGAPSTTTVLTATPAVPTATPTLTPGSSGTLTPAPDTSKTAFAVGRGCAPTPARMPAGAFHARIADMDGDGRADTEWAELLSGGTIRFGITTASGATISGQQGFAGGGDRSFVVGRLANGVVVAITSEGRDSPVYTFSGCAFHQLLGKDLLPGTDASSPFTFYSETGGGAGGCFDGRLALLTSMSTSSTEERAVARWVDVARDGRHATLTDETAVVASHIDPSDDRGRFDRYSGISCGSSPVLRPVVRR